MTLPAPTLDHVVINARDKLDDAAAAFERLGFTLTPRGFHSLGSANNLAIFGTDYLELIGTPPNGPVRPDIMTEPFGLAGLVFGTEDSASVFASLQATGVPATPPNEFTRPVDLPSGARDARFRTVHVQPAEGGPGRLYFCHHFTRDLVWRDEWRQHANGTVGVARAVIASSEPSVLRALFSRMFGDSAMRPVEGGFRLVVGMSNFDILDHATAARLLGNAADDATGRAHYMAALTLRTRSLDQAADALTQSDVAVTHATGRILVHAAEAMGCPIEFVE